MESKNYVTDRQILIVMIISRILFSSDYIPAINPGSSIQDILPSVPVVFFADIIIAVPILMLLRRNPGKDIVECSMQIMGKPFGYIVLLVYFLFFICSSALTLGVFNCFYSINILRESALFAITIPIMIVCIYGAIRGIESICRFGTLTLILYLVTMIIIFSTTVPMINTGYLKPMFYNGYNNFLKAVLAGVNSGTQVLLLAMCAPFLKPQSKVFKLYVVWDAITAALTFILYFFIVTVLGAYGSIQVFPLQTLSMLASVSVFERLDSFVMISWILNIILTISIYLFSASQCIMRTPLKKYRRSEILACAIIILAMEPFIAKNYTADTGYILSPYLFIAILSLIVAIPLIILIVDAVKKKLTKVVQ